MDCPYCDHEKTQVKDSREAKRSNAVRRRRSCTHCGGRFTTFEHVAGDALREDLMLPERSLIDDYRTLGPDAQRALLDMVSASAYVAMKKREADQLRRKEREMKINGERVAA